MAGALGISWKFVTQIEHPDTAEPALLGRDQSGKFWLGTMRDNFGENEKRMPWRLEWEQVEEVIAK